MAYQITGKLEWKGEPYSKTAKNGGQAFQRREFILDCTRYNPDTGEPWENHPKFELSSRNIGLIDNFQVGQRVTVDFSLKGTKYTDEATGEIKYFTTISAFGITLADQQPAQQPQGQAPAPAAGQPQAQEARPFPPQTDNDGNPISGNADDLPF